jgi:S1-C subfamily serine protease
LPKTTAGSFAARGIAGNFGARILSHFTIVFDYHAQTVTFTPNATVGQPLERDRSGWSLTQNHADAFDVLDVVPQGPAATAGVATGDRIVAFNGTPISSGLGLGDLVPATTGLTPYSITIERAGVRKTVTIAPRDILPAPQ